jgi:hypothetical protein
MKLKELEKVLVHTELPIIVFTNRLRWGQCESEQEVFEHRLQLADYVTIKADLEDHVYAMQGILEVCEAVAKGRYLEDRQRCDWGDHRCKYQCTRPDEHCDGFDDRDPHTAILGYLEDLHPLRGDVRHWIISQLGLHQGLREATDHLFGDKRKMYEVGVDEDGNDVLVEMSSDEATASNAKHAAEEDCQHESMALQVDQYELNLQRIRQLCVIKGDLQEIASIMGVGE